jgi:hypothetical protein
VYALKRGLGIEASTNETDDYLQTLIRLFQIGGVIPIVGLNDEVEAVKPGLREKLEVQGIEVHRHSHIGENSDPNRRRIWNPPLHQSQATWHYDQDYAMGRKPKIEAEDYPVFHADYPYLLSDAIRFIHEWKILGVSPYEAD